MRKLPILISCLAIFVAVPSLAVASHGFPTSVSCILDGAVSTPIGRSRKVIVELNERAKKVRVWMQKTFDMTVVGDVAEWGDDPHFEFDDKTWRLIARVGQGGHGAKALEITGECEPIVID